MYKVRFDLIKQMTEYDVIVVGTGLIESILAAAFARNGKKVLYVDDAKWYGGDSATLSLSEFSNLLSSNFQGPLSKAENESSQNTGEDHKISTLTGSSLSAFTPLTSSGTLPTARESDFNIDLSPKLVFCRGTCVNTLAESGVSRYLEFQIVDGMFYIPCESLDKAIHVPHSKSQVFSSSDISMVEKRQLMRFLQFCLDYQSAENVEWTNERMGAANPGRSLIRPQNKSEDSQLKEKALESASEPFSKFLKDTVRMTPRLCDVVKYGIAFQIKQSQDITVSDGMLRIGKYLGALGRFGTTPFLTAVYGTGEVCQGFSRLCAVYGGTCALGVKPCAISSSGVYLAETDSAKDAYSEKLPEYVDAKLACIVSSPYFSSQDACFPGYVSQVEVRCVVLIKGSLFGGDMGRVCFVLAPENDKIPLTQGIQLDSRSRTVPAGTFMLQLTARSAYNQEEIDLVKQNMENQIQTLASLKQVEITWMAFFVKKLYKSSTSLPLENSNVYIVGDSNASSSIHMQVDMDEAFEQAQRIFSQICPGDPFLPPSETELRAREEEQLQASLLPDVE